MFRALPSFRLLAFPALLMGAIQFFFGILSVVLFYDQVASYFIIPGILTIIVSTLLIIFESKQSLSRIHFRESMVYVGLTWIVCGTLAAIPIELIEHISFTDAMFESVSALTTTGATVLSHLDEQPKTFLMYRQFLQWLGGLGVIIFVVAILPMLNIGGMKILKAETPGPMKDDKLAPRVAQSARYLWYVYLGITFLCCLGYLLAGMSWFDAIAHSFTTVSTGGFSTHDLSLGYFNSRWVEFNADVFMVLGAISFGLHFRFFQKLDLSVYFKDEETRGFIYLLSFLSLCIAIFLITHVQYESVIDDILKAVFLLISFITSTGFGSGDFTSWPFAATLILVFSGYLGGCAGSTAGGNKIIRNILSFKIIKKQIAQLIHPNAMLSVKYNGRTISQEVLSATIAFMTISAFITSIFTMALTATGLDFWSAFSAVSSCINVLGPAFGELSNNFQPVNDAGTWMLTFTMLLGRLEFFTILVVFSKYYWR